jgi:cell division protein FtsA
MGWFLRRKAKSKKKYLLALDIGTEFVKALIFRLEEELSDEGEIKEQGVIIGVGRQRQLPGHMLVGAVADIDGVALTCQKAINQAVQEARVKPKRAVVGIAGEFIKGATTNFVCQRENSEEIISLAELQNLIQKIQWRAFDRMRRQLAYETCRPEIEIKPINALLTEVRIDGYQVTNPLGFQGKEIFLSIFTVYAPLVHLRAVESIASKLDLELLSIAAEPYALTKTSCFNPTAGAIFIDIGGGTTDIALDRRNKVEGIKSFALAGRTFTKRLGKTFDLDLMEAERIKIRHSQKRLSRNVQRKIREIFKNDIGVWLNGVELVLEEFDQAEYFPPLILLCGGGSLLPGIRTVLKKEEIKKRWLKKFILDPPNS